MKITLRSSARTDSKATSPTDCPFTTMRTRCAPAPGAITFAVSVIRTSRAGHSAVETTSVAPAETGIKPSPPADRPTLVRRLSFDLRGLPPTLAEVDEFLADKSDDAYAKLVDRMLASPRFGEKMAQLWLDLARFGDTSGYNQDSTRQMWLWR